MGCRLSCHLMPSKARRLVWSIVAQVDIDEAATPFLTHHVFSRVFGQHVFQNAISLSFRLVILMFEIDIGTGTMCSSANIWWMVNSYSHAIENKSRLFRIHIFFKKNLFCLQKVSTRSTFAFATVANRFSFESSILRMSFVFDSWLFSRRCWLRWHSTMSIYRLHLKCPIWCLYCYVTWAIPMLLLPLRFPFQFFFWIVFPRYIFVCFIANVEAIEWLFSKFDNFYWVTFLKINATISYRQSSMNFFFVLLRISWLMLNFVIVVKVLDDIGERCRCSRWRIRRTRSALFTRRILSTILFNWPIVVVDF